MLHAIHRLDTVVVSGMAADGAEGFGDEFNRVVSCLAANIWPGEPADEPKDQGHQ